jgi:hypothetical protein
VLWAPCVCRSEAACGREPQWQRPVCVVVAMCTRFDAGRLGMMPGLLAPAYGCVWAPHVHHFKVVVAVSRSGGGCGRSLISDARLHAMLGLWAPGLGCVWGAVGTSRLSFQGGLWPLATVMVVARGRTLVCGCVLTRNVGVVAPGPRCM